MGLLFPRAINMWCSWQQQISIQLSSPALGIKDRIVMCFKKTLHWKHAHILPKPIEPTVKFPFQPGLLQPINGSFFTGESLGAFTLDHYLCLWNQFVSILDYGLCQEEGSLLLAFRALDSSPCVSSLQACPLFERKLLVLEHMWFGRAWCEHVSASNQCCVPTLHAYYNLSLIIIMPLAGPASKETCL